MHLESTTTGEASHQPESSTHPIHECRVDVLQCIFETATLFSTNPFTTAIILSHVCRRWREIAVDTPLLWAEITCPLNRPSHQVKELWDILSSRVKNVPAIINISKLGAYGSPLLQNCRLDQIPHILRLNFLIETGGAIQEILDPLFQPPTGRLDELEFRPSKGAISQRSDIPWDLEDILDQFLGVRKFIIFGGLGIDVNSIKATPSIESLTLHGIGAVDLSTVSASFSNLRSLSLMTLEVMDLESPCVFQNMLILRILGIENESSLWIRHLSCPQLTELQIDDKMPLEATLDFINTHRTIKNLQFTSPYDLNQITLMAPQVRYLVVSYIDESFYRNNNPALLPFPLLEILTIINTDDWMEADVLEELVSARCLEVGHSRNSRPLSMKMCRGLIIVISASIPFSQYKVYKCDLVQEVQIKSMQMTESWRIVTLSWVNGLDD